jgi:hypothetical protein
LGWLTLDHQPALSWIMDEKPLSSTKSPQLRGSKTTSCEQTT